MSTDQTQPETACSMHIGARREQQDRVAVWTDGPAYLLVLADGAGGHAGGAMAAQALVDAARDHFTICRTALRAGVLSGVVASGHERINALTGHLESPAHTTCVLLYVDESTQAWAHVGDSRLYRFEAGRLVERTLDHSVVELLRLEGKISDADMRDHPDQNKLYAALGGAEAPKVVTGGKRTAPTDGFLLASDGLWSHVTVTELEAAICAPDLAAAIDTLVARARARGGDVCDNISAAALRHDRPHFYQRCIARHLRRLRRVLGAWPPTARNENA